MTERTITTSAVGHASTPPDEVNLTFSASASDPDVTSARREVAEQATRLRRFLDDAGVPEDRVRTRRFRVRQRPPGPDSREDDSPRPYRATETVDVTLHDLGRLDAALSAAVDEARAEIDEVGFSFRTETERALRREAVGDAVTAARAKATAAGDAEDLTVEDVLSITTDDASPPRRTTAGRQAMRATTESGSVQSGPIEVTARVEVEYRLGEA